jgi:phosphoribulokinase
MKGGSPFQAALAELPRTYVIGVTGDSGSGKSTFTAGLRHLFGDQLVSTITLDDYHLYDREERRIRDITPLVPEANDLEGLERDLRALKAGTAVRKKIYNHTTGTFEGPEEVSPSRILILEGLHTLFSPGLRGLLDFSLYVDPAPDVKREWKVKRDVGRRGYSEREVMEEMRRRQADYFRYIAPQQEHADTVIHITFSRFGRELGWARDIYRVTFLQKPLRGSGDEPGFSLSLPVLATTGTCSFSLECSHRMRNGTMNPALTVDGEWDQRFFCGITRYLEEETGVNPAAAYRNRNCITPSEIIQLVFCWRVIQDIRSRS